MVCELIGSQLISFFSTLIYSTISAWTSRSSSPKVFFTQVSISTIFSEFRLLFSYSSSQLQATLPFLSFILSFSASIQILSSFALIITCCFIISLFPFVIESSFLFSSLNLFLLLSSDLQTLIFIHHSSNLAFCLVKLILISDYRLVSNFSINSSSYIASGLSYNYFLCFGFAHIFILFYFNLIACLFYVKVARLYFFLVSGFCHLEIVFYFVYFCLWFAE